MGRAIDLPASSVALFGLLVLPEVHPAVAPLVIEAESTVAALFHEEIEMPRTEGLAVSNIVVLGLRKGFQINCLLATSSPGVHKATLSLTF
jgi:hypothetical protein